MREERAFYLVWRDGGGAPTYKHPDRSGAVLEAERLSRNAPGVAFYILEATDRAVFTQPVAWTKLEEETPF